MDIYLDNSATTQVCREAVDAMLPLLTENYGNPSAVHAKGVRAKTALETARGRIADVLSCAPEEVYFSHFLSICSSMPAVYMASPKAL